MENLLLSLSYLKTSEFLLPLWYKFSKEMVNTHYLCLFLLLSPLNVALWLHLSFYWNLSHCGHQLNPDGQTEWTLFQSSSYKIALVVLTPLIILSVFGLSDLLSGPRPSFDLLGCPSHHFLQVSLRRSSVFLATLNAVPTSHPLFSQMFCFHCHPPSQLQWSAPHS